MFQTLHAKGHRKTTHVVRQAPQISVIKVDYGNDFSENSRRRMLRPEQKSVALVKGLVQRLFQPGDLGVRCICCGIFYSERIFNF